MEGEENIGSIYDKFDIDNPVVKCMDPYILPPVSLKATEVGLTVDQIYSRCHFANRKIIENYKRLRTFKNKNLKTSNQRIMYFKNELEKKRISFLDDSITLVINRDNILEDTLNQISTTDAFDFHKEIKIFFIDEEAQDAGGVLKEWVFSLLKQIFGTKSETRGFDNDSQSSKHSSPTKRFKKSKSFIGSGKSSSGELEDIITKNLKTPKYAERNSELNKFSKTRVVGISNLDKIEDEKYEDSKGNNPENEVYFNTIKSGGDVYYEFKSNTPLKICKLVGQIVGKALFEDIPIEPKLTHFLLK